MWHVTRDTDTWHMTCLGGVNILSLPTLHWLVKVLVGKVFIISIIYFTILYSIIINNINVLHLSIQSGNSPGKTFLVDAEPDV